jgi:alpha-glucosidase
MWLSIPMACGFGLSGQPFVGADIGGFFGHSNADLFLRWMQYGALTPFCRNHSAIGNVDQYAWAWGEAVRDVVRDAVRLRYRLLPYLYASFLRASETGAPVQRPLVFDHQEDLVARDVDDEYLLGPDLLVAPVLQAGVTARQVYLPAGTWYDWQTGERVRGRRYVQVATPMERIPLYARGGAVVPMWPQAPASTAGHHPEAVELHLFVPGEDGSHESLMQEDDGLTFAALQGARVRTRLQVTRAGGRVELRADVDGDGFPELVRRELHLFVHGATPSVVRLEGEGLQPVDGRFVIPNAGTAFRLDFDLD